MIKFDIGDFVLRQGDTFIPENLILLKRRNVIGFSGEYLGNGKYIAIPDDWLINPALHFSFQQAMLKNNLYEYDRERYVHFMKQTKLMREWNEQISIGETVQYIRYHKPVQVLSKAFILKTNYCVARITVDAPFSYSFVDTNKEYQTIKYNLPYDIALENVEKRKVA